jgi:CHAD domain-containing protein
VGLTPVSAQPGASPVAGPSTTEVELKLDVLDTAPARALLEADVLDGLQAAGPVVVIESEDHYLDTRDGALRREGWAARLRSTPGEPDATLALKSTARRSSGAVHRRFEEEGPARLDLEPASWPASGARDRLLALAGDRPIETTVVLQQRRRQRTFGDGSISVEVSLDRVRTLLGGRVVDRSMVLEAELRGGSEERLELLGEALTRHSFLVPARTSKLARSLAAAERARLLTQLPDLATTKSPGVTGDDLVAEAGRKVLAFHFARMLAREAGTRDGRDPEELHQMRVATRRMRAAWRVFGDAFSPRLTRAIRADLRTLASSLGAVRDLDVLLEDLGTAEQNLPHGGAAGLAPLAASLRADRDHARRELLRQLERPGYRRWVERSVTFLTTTGAGALPVQADAPRRVREVAPARIWAEYGHVRAFGESLRWADVPTLHALRIACKRLRYTLEFIGEGLGPDLADLLVGVTALQDHLGLLNDGDVAAARARTWLVENGGAVSPAQREAVGHYLVSREREVARLRRTVGRPWAKVDGVAFRRRLGRAVARL